MKDTLTKGILHTIKKYRMLKPLDKVLVGFSGGPDSMALLYALYTIKDILNIKLYALHINHQLRPKAALQDEKFAVRVCQKLHIPIKTKRINVGQYARKYKMSFEEAARVLRYQELAKITKVYKCNKIALGHNANDNVETVIFNLVRGAGLKGLSGIPPRRANIIRPLIETSRADILQYLKSRKLKYCHDLTNIELGYRRNYIRHKIIPLLLEINPNLIKTILRTSEIIRETNKDIIKMTKQAKKDVVKHEGKNRYGIDIKKLLSYNQMLQREIIKTLLPKMEFEQIESLIALASKPTGKRIELTRDWLAWREYDRLYITRYRENKIEPANKTWQVNIGRLTKIPALGIELQAKIRKSAVNPQYLDGTKTAVFDKSEIALPIFIRLRQTGDRFTPYKGKEKKLKDILIDDKIPYRLRDRLPLLCDARNILWIVGSRRSNFGLITNETKEIIEIKKRTIKHDYTN
jgi:tRNA(Ile)-lysidine synthase